MELAKPHVVTLYTGWGAVTCSGSGLALPPPTPSLGLEAARRQQVALPAGDRMPRRDTLSLSILHHSPPPLISSSMVEDGEVGCPEGSREQEASPLTNRSPLPCSAVSLLAISLLPTKLPSLQDQPPITLVPYPSGDLALRAAL